MKKLLLVALVPILLAGCVSNQAFRSEQERVNKMESALAQNNTELGVLRKEIMQDRKMGSAGNAEELEALTMVVRDISDEQMKQNALMQEDIAYLMDHLSTTPSADGSAPAADPQLAKKVNDLASLLERNKAEVDGKIAAIEQHIAGLKDGTMGSATYSDQDLAAVQAQMVAQRKEMEAEIAALRQAMNQSATPATKPTAMQTTHTAADLGVDAEREVYEAARMEYNNGNYDKAIEMLDAFIAQYPNSDYAGNANYWKGESRYAKSEWAAALKEFQAVVTRYPGSWKEADSQLKIGMCHLNMGNNSEARAALNNLKRQYPYYGRMDLVNSYLNQLN